MLIYLLQESALVKYVLDSSALLSGKEFEGELFIVPGVQRELRKYGVTPQLAAFLDTKVRILTPAKEAIIQIQNKAKETGDDRRLSPVDMDLLALASELSATLVTDDYSIENLAKALGIPYEAVMMPPITEEVRWKYRCTGCRKIWPEWHDACPICGAPLRTSRPKKT